MQRPTVLIISEEPEFARAVSTRWQEERNAPVFLFNDAQAKQFELAIVGTDQVATSLRRSGAAILHMSDAKGSTPDVIRMPKVDGWPHLVITVAKQILERRALLSEVTRLSQIELHLEREAALGRYILEARHNLNNALTSILGNSELMLLDQGNMDPNFRQPVETIRNMGMRMNEILQRFTSLQKEMQLTEQQSPKKFARSAVSGI